MSQAGDPADLDPRAPIPRASLAPGMVPPDVLPVLWRQSIAPFFDARPNPALQGPPAPPSIHQFHLGQAIFGDAGFSGQTFTRDEAWMRRHHDADHLLLQLFVEGENRVVNGKHEYVEQPGNVYAVNLGYRIQAASTDAHVLSLVLPRDLVRDEVPHLAEAAGPIFAPDSTAARIFVDYMQSLARNLPHARAGEIPTIARSTIGLLDSLTLTADVGSVVAVDATFSAVCRYIDAHLGDPALGVDRICAYLRCSRATVYRLFKAHGGVHAFIQRRRLVACFKALGSPRHSYRRIFDIAFDFGFASPSHFSHLFRAHFGLTPRQAREAALARPGGPPEAQDPAHRLDDGERMWLWAKTLTGQGPATPGA